MKISNIDVTATDFWGVNYCQTAQLFCTTFPYWNTMSVRANDVLKDYELVLGLKSSITRLPPANNMPPTNSTKSRLALSYQYIVVYQCLGVVKNTYAWYLLINNNYLQTHSIKINLKYAAVVISLILILNLQHIEYTSQFNISRTNLYIILNIKLFMEINCNFLLGKCLYWFLIKVKYRLLNHVVTGNSLSSQCCPFRNKKSRNF